MLTQQLIKGVGLCIQGWFLLENDMREAGLGDSLDEYRRLSRAKMYLYFRQQRRKV